VIDLRIQTGDFDPGRQLARLGDLKEKAVASFTALLEVAPGVEAAIIEHYAALAKVELRRVAQEAQRCWPLAGLILIHRHGRLAPGDRLAFAGVAACDRAAALEALAFLIEALATRAPFWRKEVMADGTAAWRR
jgi:molybdopterin synthase catalytic subunit